ncbi:MAG: CHAT domain-containing protein [Caulobacteraceae bacterium]|nr:CHAT domain-containing protein [Caulobacteraceae bacterium]
MSSRQSGTSGPSQSPSVAIVAPTGRNAPPLARFESDAVSGQFPIERRRDLTASGDGPEVLSALPGSDYWHIASHGVWDFERQDRSGILLSGRTPTTIDEVLTLRASPVPRLVFLSACSTNLISTESDLNGFVGLNTAFLNTGATGVIGTQWPVDDAATAPCPRNSTMDICGRFVPCRRVKKCPSVARTSSPAELATFIDTLVQGGKIDAQTSEAAPGYVADLSGERPFEAPSSGAAFNSTECN